MTAGFVVSLNLAGRRCVVVGSSEELEERVFALRDAGAIVRVVSQAPPNSVRALAERSEIELYVREFQPTDIDDTWLVTLVDMDAEMAQTISAAAEARSTLFCAIDQPKFNTFAHVARARAGALEVAISTQGKAPALAKRLRIELERVFEKEDAKSFIEQLSELREQTPAAERRAVMTNAVTDVQLDLKLPKKSSS